jgi:hypothetical protein
MGPKHLRVRDQSPHLSVFLKKIEFAVVRWESFLSVELSDLLRSFRQPGVPSDAMNGSESSVNANGVNIPDSPGPSVASGASQSRFSRAISQFIVQLRILLWKNVILFARNWKSTVGQLVAPIIVVLLLLGSF